jgi:hypothetical protein
MPLSAPRVVRSAVTQSPSTIGLDGIGQEIMVGIGGLLRNHVHVALENHTAAILEARGGRRAENDVAGFVLHHFHIVVLAPLEEIFNDFLFVLGGPRDLRQSVEVAPYHFGFQIFDAHIVFSVLMG